MNNQHASSQDPRSSRLYLEVAARFQKLHGPSARIRPKGNRRASAAYREKVKP